VTAIGAAIAGIASHPVNSWTGLRPSRLETVELIVFFERVKSVICILTYRRVNSLRLLLEQVIVQCPDAKIAVFEDCGQCDGTEAYLLENSTFLRRDMVYEADVYDRGGVQIYLAHSNVGVTGNSNKAIRWFMEQEGYDHLCLCNDDLEVTGAFHRSYAHAHALTEVGLFCFTDFTSESYAYAVVKHRGIQIKLMQRMTGIMMSMTRALVEKIGYYDADSFTFGQEHSLTGDTLVLLSDYTWKPISDVVVGEKVIGWRDRTECCSKYSKMCAGKKMHHLWKEFYRTNVLKTHSYESEVLEITLESGNVLRCTPDHLWYNGRVGRKDHFQSPKVGLRMRRAHIPSACTTIDYDYAVGYIAGAMDGDGSYGKKDHHQHALRVTDKDFVSRFCSMLSLVGIAYESKPYKYNAITTGGEFVEKRDATVITFNFLFSSVSNKPAAYYAGWLGGIYDAEGSQSAIAQSIDVNPDVYENVVGALLMFNFCLNKKPHQIEWKGGAEELLRFWNIARPACFYKADIRLLQGVETVEDRIKSMRSVGIEKVYCLTTESGNYLAEGYMSHNCDATNRARLAGFININGKPQHCLDVVCDLLKHQDVPSSLTDIEKQNYNAVGDVMIEEVAKTYHTADLYRPFSTGKWALVAGGRDGLGTPIRALNRYSRVKDNQLDRRVNPPHYVQPKIKDTQTVEVGV
jgi:intein/homing endonuclease